MTSEQEGGLAADASCNSAAVPLDEVFRVGPPQGVQHARHHKGLTQQAVRVPPWCHLCNDAQSGFRLPARSNQQLVDRREDKSIGQLLI